MSLKAKLEAVIYAAEEPVTLAQLAELFGGEALAWKAEQDAVARTAETDDSAAEERKARRSITRRLRILTRMRAWRARLLFRRLRRLARRRNPLAMKLLRGGGGGQARGPAA